MLKDSNFCDHRMTFVSIDIPGTIFGRMRMMFSHLCASSCGWWLQLGWGRWLSLVTKPFGFFFEFTQIVNTINVVP